MVRTVEKKYQIWLAGYYDDFNGARAIPDDENRPSDTTYSATKSHFGNPMNGEAFLNPRFRFSVEEREDDAGLTTNNFIATDDNRYLQNDGIFEWLTHDDTRLKRDEWEGRAQLQYPDGHIANRYKFDNDSAYGTSFYQRFINGHNSDASYLIPIGDNDATFGRAETLEYTTANYNIKKAGVNTATDTKKTFMQRGHLAGVFMGEVLALDAVTPSDTTTPKNTFQEIYSPAKKPFLCIQSTRENFDDDSPNTPTLIYDGHLNTRLDGDIFTARIALQSMMLGSAWSDIGVKFEVGFASSQAGLLSDTGYTGTPAIDFTLDLADISYDTSVYVGGATNDNMWIDVDFVFDYTNNKFRAYYNGTEITSTNASAGSYSSSAPKGYAMSGGGTTTASNLYGYQLTVTDTGTNPTGDNGYVSYLMIDRAGLVRYLTDDITTTEEVHIQSMKLNQTNNGMSVCELKIADDPDLTGGVRGAASTDYVYNLRNLFVASAPLDWNLLIFADKTSRIDRPVWRGEISNFHISQKDRSRIITLKALDSLAYLDRQVPLWDVGQKGQNTSEDSTDYWTYDAQGFRNSMYLGGDKLKLLDGNVGFDTDNSYKESSNQRTQLGSGHPIQMYNDEDVRGPNNIEDLYEGYGIIGITKDTSANTVLILQDSSHGITTLTSLNIDTSKHDASGVTPTNVTGAEITIASGDLAFTSESAKICYIGKYPSVLEASYTDYYIYTGNNFSASPTPIDEWYAHDSWLSICAASPNATDFNLSANVTSLKTYVYFDADPNLKTDDTFYIARENQANSVNLSSAYTGEHKVLSVTKIRNYFSSFSSNDPTTTLEYMWVVKTDTDYSGSESHGVYTSDTLLSGTGRFGWSNDKGQITNVQSNNMTAMQQRAIHAKWMKDLSKSLWFKYHFGVVKKASANDAPPFPQTGNITTAGKGARTNRISASQTISPTTTIIEIDEYAYDNAPNAGVAEIWATPDIAPATYPHATDYKEKFIYQGKVAVSGSPNKWYLVGAKYITGTYAIDASYNYSEDSVNKRLYLRFQDYEDSYKHIWLLWADMRNNGEANADGSQRKADFGLQYPTSNNYNVNLYFADQTDADGNLDMFGSLKIGEDLDIWNIDPRTETITGGAFSKPVDFDNLINSGITFQENSSGDTKLRVVKTNHGFRQGDYVYIYNTNLHDGFYEIEGAPAPYNYFYLKAGTWKGSDTGLTGGIHIAPITGSGARGESTAYQNWEDKAGALLVIDTAKFFNLNTHANGGKTGQSAGGRTDLTDYVVESNGDRAGFPTLIDNYWTEATSTYQTTADQIRQHPNQNHLISSATNASRGFPDGFIGLPVADASEFAETGIGKLVAVMSQTDNKPNTITHYFHWDGKLETTYTAGGTITSVGTPFNHTGLDGICPLGHTNYGSTLTIQVVTIVQIL